jgi:signal transduction histidine kinase
VKHARATNIDLSLERHNGHLHMHINDDGTGFDPDGEFPAPGPPLHARTHAGNRGTFELWSAPGQGTRIKVTAPTAAGEPPRLSRSG